MARELKDEEMDNEMPENLAVFMEMAFYWYSERTSYVLTTLLTELLSKSLRIENDVNLNCLDIVERLISEVEEPFTPENESK